MDLKGLKLRKTRQIEPGSALVLENKAGIQVLESDCEGSEYLDHVTVYVSMDSRLVVAVADFKGTRDTRKVRGVPTGRRAVQGQRPGSQEDFLSLLSAMGLVVVDGEG